MCGINQAIWPSKRFILCECSPHHACRNGSEVRHQVAVLSAPGARSFRFSGRATQYQPDCSCKPGPALCFVFQLFSSFGRKPVELRLAAGLRFFPFRRKQSSVFETVQGGIERSLLYLQHVPRDLLYTLRDRNIRGSAPTPGSAGSADRACLAGDRIWLRLP